MAKAKAKRTSASKTRKTARGAARSATRRKKTAAGRKKAASPPSRRKSSSRTKAVSRKAAGRKAAGRKTAARKTAARKTAGRKKTAARTMAAGRKAAPERRRSAAKAAGARTPARRAASRKTPTKKTAARPAAAPPAASTSRRAARARVEPAHGRPPALERERRRLPESDLIPSPPSSLDLDRTASAARSGQAEIAEHLAEHTETGPEITAGDVDASWGSAYTTGDEAPGGDNPTPDQDVVDEIGRSLGLVYEDSEELKGADKISERDKHRWELDPASSEDYRER